MGSLARGHSRTWAVIGGLALVASVVACQATVATPAASRLLLRTQATPDPSVPTACMQAKGGGTLVADPVSGLGFGDASGHLTHVWWLSGYTAHEDGERMALVDAAGNVVAHIGDVVGTAGGFVTDNDWVVCGADPIVVLATFSPPT
jgi:hypothetical protein